MKTGTSLTWSTVPFSKIVVMSKEVLGRRRNIPVKNWNLRQWHRFTFGQKLHTFHLSNKVCHRSALLANFVWGQPYLPSLSKVSPTCQVCQRSIPAKFVKGQPYLPERSAPPAKFVKGQPYLLSLPKVSPTFQVCHPCCLGLCPSALNWGTARPVHQSQTATDHSFHFNFNMVSLHSKH